MFDVDSGNILYQIGMKRDITASAYSDGLLIVQHKEGIEMFNFQREKIESGEVLFRKKRMIDGTVKK